MHFSTSLADLCCESPKAFVQERICPPCGHQHEDNSGITTIERPKGRNSPISSASKKKLRLVENIRLSENYFISVEITSRFRKRRKPRFILVYEGECEKCTFFSGLVGIFDFRGRIKRVELRTGEAYNLLSAFYDKIPYAFHFIDDENDICYTGLPVIPNVFRQLWAGFFKW